MDELVLTHPVTVDWADSVLSPTSSQILFDVDGADELIYAACMLERSSMLTRSHITVIARILTDMYNVDVYPRLDILCSVWPTAIVESLVQALHPIRDSQAVVFDLQAILSH